MKRPLLLLLIIVCSYQLLAQNWTNLDIVPANKNFYALSFINDSVGYAVQTSQTTFKTSDGGQSWISLNTAMISSNTTYPNTLVFIDEQNGWVAGTTYNVNDKGSICYTSDGGNNWTLQYETGAGGSINDIHMFSVTNGVAVGSGGLYLTTIDGGQSWLPSSIPTNYDIHDIDFIDNQNGWMLAHDHAGKDGTLNPNAEILKTTNGGTNWTVISLSSLAVSGDFYEISFVDQNNGWMSEVGISMSNFYESSIWHTTDGGANWTEQSFSYPNNNRKHPLYDIEFRDVSYGIVSGGNPCDSMQCYNASFAMETMDGGNTWIPVWEENSGREFNDIAITANNVYVLGFRSDSIGNYGRVIKRDGFIITIEESKQSLAGHLYPNPVTDHLKIEFGELAGKYQSWYITDIMGKLHLQGTQMNSVLHIPTATLPSGVYFLGIVGNKERIASRFIKK